MSDALHERMSAQNTAPLWVVIPQIERLGRISGLQRVVLFGWTRGVVLAFTVGDWQRFEAVYGSACAAQLVGDRQHKLILRTQDARASEWASDLLCGMPAEEIRGLADGRGLFRHAGAYPTTEVDVTVPLLEAA